LYNEKAFNHIAVLALIWHAAAKQLFPKQFAQFTKNTVGSTVKFLLQASNEHFIDLERTI